MLRRTHTLAMPLLATLLLALAAGCGSRHLYDQSTTEGRLRKYQDLLDKAERGLDSARYAVSGSRHLGHAARRAGQAEKMKSWYWDSSMNVGLTAFMPSEDSLGPGLGISFVSNSLDSSKGKGTYANSFAVNWARFPEAAAGGSHDVFRLGGCFWRSFSTDIHSGPLPYVGAEFGKIWDVSQTSPAGGWYAEVLVGLSCGARGRGVNFMLGHMWAAPGSTKLDAVVQKIAVPLYSD